MRHLGRGIPILLACIAIQATATAELVTGRVVSAGFPAAVPAGCVVRLGQWFPIHLQLALQGTGTVTRDIKFESIDLDGDRVGLIRPQVTLSTEGGGGTRDVWCYGLINALDELPETLALIDERGQARERLTMPAVEYLPNDDMLVVDLSDNAITALNRLATAGWSAGQRANGTRDYYRNVVISKMTPQDLPDRWIGLEAADVIVWDKPSATDLKRIAPTDALLAWVDNGGQLVVGLGEAWPNIRGTALAARLPLVGDGAFVSLTDLPVFRERFLVTALAKRPLDRAMTAVTADLAPDAVRTLGEHGGPRGSVPLITMRPAGMGRIVATAVSLRDLTASPTKDDQFFASLLELNKFTSAFKEQQKNIGQQLIQPRYLYDALASAIGFGTATALRGLLAFVFVGGYVFAATLLTWLVLIKRGRTALSWPAFALIAALASVLSLGTVGVTRGCSSGVQTLQLLDMASGDTGARGYCYFGFRSAVRARDNLALSGANTFLRPLARSSSVGQRRFFVTPDRYAGVPTNGTLEDVLVRATLKQVEGFWSGDVGGSLRGQLVADRATGRLTGDSFLASDLDAPIRGGYLIYTDPRIEDNGVPRPSGWTQLYDRPTDKELPEVPPSRGILAVAIGAIEPRARVSQLGAAAYKDVDAALPRWQQFKDRKRAAMPDLRTLLDEQVGWMGGTAGGMPASQAVLAALLASTRSYYLNVPGALALTGLGVEASTDGLPNLDVTHWLVNGRDASGQNVGTAILICWTDAPGPARLSINGAPQRAYAGTTVYRVRIPLAYQGAPPREEPP